MQPGLGLFYRMMTSPAGLRLTVHPICLPVLLTPWPLSLAVSVSARGGSLDVWDLWLTLVYRLGKLR